jgi:hypothetical protein
VGGESESKGYDAPMNHRTLGALGALLLMGSLSAASEDAAGPRVPLNLYLKAHATGDPSHIRKAFLSTARIEGLRDGKLVSMNLEEFCTRFSGQPAADEAQRKRSIDTVDVKDSAASARITLVHGQTIFTDYFVLLKVDGEWKIASKVYVANPTN